MMLGGAGRAGGTFYSGRDAAILGDYKGYSCKNLTFSSDRLFTPNVSSRRMANTNSIKN